MTKNILAVFAGIVAWTVLWLGSNAILKMLGQLPADSTKRVENISSLLLLLVGSVVFSIAAGFLTAHLSAGSGYGPPVILGLILLAMGIFFQTQVWQLLPVWYHLVFLLLLVPATLLGAWWRLH